MEQVMWKVTWDTALTHGTGDVEGDPGHGPDPWNR